LEYPDSLISIVYRLTLTECSLLSAVRCDSIFADSFPEWYDNSLMYSFGVKSTEERLSAMRFVRLRETLCGAELWSNPVAVVQLFAETSLGRLRSLTRGLFVASLCVAANAATVMAGDEAFFTEYIEPMFEEHCYGCHSHEYGEASGGLVLDSKAGWSIGGDSGPAVVPNEVEKSVLWQAVSYENASLEMPPDGKLSEENLNLIKKWIKNGAVDPRADGKAAERKKIDIEAGRQWWAFQPYQHDAKVAKHTPAQASSYIDERIAARVAEAGLELAPPARDNVLLRRLAYDLTGLPPTEQIQDLTYDQAIDRLLASQQFGEKWGRHWLDLARYADSNGSSFNPPFKEAWRYRNWVIDAMNAGMPVDEFIRKQLAGDLLPAETQEERDKNLIATGYLMLGSKVLGAFDKEQLHLDVIDEQLNTVSKSLLAMTVACARCHDHKFDPIPQSDYYAMAGIFASTVTLDNRLGGDNADESDWSRRGLGEEGDEQLRAFLKHHRHRWTKATSKRFQAVRELDQLQEKLESTDEAKRIELKEEIAEAKEELEKAEQMLREYEEQMPAYAMAVRDQESPEDIALRIRGVASSPGDIIPRGFLQVAAFDEQPEVEADQSGRLELAKWITSSENPLTARVFVNRVWRHLFGEGLVRSMDNFGTTGEKPSHPELLDYLAERFIQSGWKLKPLIREIVMTNAYQMAVQEAPASDPENRLLSHQNRRRLQPEEIRDTLLYLSGNLEDSMGTGMLGHLPLSDVSNLGDYLDVSDNRRTIYQPVVRTLEPDVLQLFDSANNAMPTGSRPRTIVAPQALYFLNSQFVQASAAEIADRLFEEYEQLAEVRGEIEQTKQERLAEVVELAFASIICRPPTAAESDLMTAYLMKQADGPYGLTQHDTMKLCQAILGSTQFQFLD